MMDVLEICCETESGAVYVITHEGLVKCSEFLNPGEEMMRHKKAVACV